MKVHPTRWLKGRETRVLEVEWTDLMTTRSKARTTSKRPIKRRGNIRHSIAHWCCESYSDKWTVEKTCKAAVQLGAESVELVAPKDYPTLKKYGLTSAINLIDANPPFVRGYNNPANWVWLNEITKDAIDAAASFKVPNVICFTGYAAKNPDNPRSPKISPEEGLRNCVRGLKTMVKYAEKKRVTLCLEQLNTRVSNHPMKGHPGYQGDNIDYCAEIVKRVGSKRLKLLFDVYHVQIMSGDVIQRIRDYGKLIGHVHVAGVPGRAELTEDQELNFPAIMRALLEVGYKGFVGQEFIPTINPLRAMNQAITLCDV